MSEQNEQINVRISAETKAKIKSLAQSCSPELSSADVVRLMIESWLRGRAAGDPSYTLNFDAIQNAKYTPLRRK